MLDVAEVVCSRRAGAESIATEEVVTLLAHHGAVRFRGANLNRQAFARFTSRLGKRHSGDPTKNRDHRWAHRSKAISWLLRKGSRMLDLVSVDDGSRLAPSTLAGINPHNENTFLPAACPDVIWLKCQQPATDGGDSLLCDGAEVLAALTPATRTFLEQNRVRYSLSFTQDEWRAVYCVETKRQLEQLLQATDHLAWRLDNNGTFHYDYDTVQIQPMRFDDRPALKSNLLSHQPYQQLDENTREKMTDGKPVPISVITELLEVTRAQQTTVRLDAGDLLLLDNSRVMHGRTPYTDTARSVITRISWLDP